MKTIWKLIWGLSRIIAKLLLIAVGLYILIVGLELVLSKIMPQSPIVLCGFLSSEQCDQRLDCEGFTIGGVGGPGHSTCVKR